MGRHGRGGKRKELGKASRNPQKENFLGGGPRRCDPGENTGKNTGPKRPSKKRFAVGRSQKKAMLHASPRGKRTVR